MTNDTKPPPRAWNRVNTICGTNWDGNYSEGLAEPTDVIERSYATRLEEELAELREENAELKWKLENITRGMKPAKVAYIHKVGGLLDRLSELADEVAELKRQLDSAMVGMNEYAMRLRDAEAELASAKGRKL